MKALLQRKSVRIGLGVGIILFNACMVYAWVEFVHQTHTRAIERDFARAVEQWEQAPPGVERVEKFVQALKEHDAKDYARTVHRLLAIWLKEPAS